ncbi:2,3-diaminopropionate biosynthesis protein SbnB [Burkholderia glumae]|uniref:2,3-diaminopropionate biosynthesis protein SbnB n=1 Tax=Burkholderia glumae TaxID=337 RepID=UPI0002E7940F|nr:2,3-diaminopropionate biosynthesis protein SbnB [Burkholderia glumae]MCM2494900.1 2,3-diaminopropionate biosynthesis protein SbnB [Burkholderia glumae]MCM2545765.1 2,3-diaminopropionate biosynthesis protein SbnB [Burkholderia glumae]PJO22573.1 2,3-diaminopropionate biosynthesis protein SbnB [Burkholderia glumae AU6208]QHE13762.1 2,3-diaminopropionate biosynthesis protein SbnB [Burkholderia glumae AU6208]
MTQFTVVPGSIVSGILGRSHADILNLVSATYLAHEQGQSINPDSYFLRFPAKPDSRVIALPAYLGGQVDTIGIKWIASFPGNVARGLPRASAVLLLNDYSTGYPLACLEAAGISAARTAASAAVAARTLLGTGESVRVAFVGAGVIARTIADYLLAAGLRFASALVHDPDPSSADHLATHVSTRAGLEVTLGSLDAALDHDLVVFATTAATPYVGSDAPLRAGQVLLNISLRDLAPQLLLRANNVVDDVDHCLKAQTSPHLAEQLTGNRDFIAGTLGQLIGAGLALDPQRPTIFSPFGLGILDIAVGHYVLQQSRERGEAIVIPDFIGDASRW